MLIASPFSPRHAIDLHRWLNSPRDPNFSDAQASDLETVTAMLAEKTAAGVTFAAFVDGEPIGFIGFARTAKREGQFAGMVMAPEFRGVGLGTQFLRAVVDELRGTHGYRRMSAVVRSDNGAIQATFASAGAVQDLQVWSFVETGKGSA